MFNSDILEVAIGLTLVFALTSTICSAVREGIEAWLKTRAAYLEHAIRELLDDPNAKDLARDLLEHPLVFGLYNGQYTPGKSAGKPPGPWTSGNQLPSYIPSGNFALALLDIAARGPKPLPDSPNASTTLSLEAVRASLSKHVRSDQVRRALLVHLDSAQNG